MKKVMKVLGIVLLLLSIYCIYYVNDYYHAKDIVSESLTENVEVVEDDHIVFKADNPEYGFIFYPGGKVEYTAYAKLCSLLASKNIECILVKMPCNLAVLNSNKAEDIIDEYKHIEHWYIGGHSLGGSMAASYASSNNHIEGLVLLGAYSTKPIDIKVLSIYGSEDHILNKDKYNSNLDLLEDVEEYVIEGGNHAGFGEYGHQEGDGNLYIDNQIQLTSEYIYNFITSQKDE